MKTNKMGTLMQNSSADTFTLAELGPGQSGCVVKIEDDTIGHNLAAMGLVKGTTVSVERSAPMGNPRIYSVMGYRLSLRNEDASKVLLRKEIVQGMVSSINRHGAPRLICSVSETPE